VQPPRLQDDQVLLARPQYLVRSGPDGADHALLAVLRHDNIAARLGRAAVASGDIIFAAAVADLAASGCQVTVVSRRGRLSKTLELAASQHVLHLDAPGHLPADVNAA
jgi:hypothetical protein